MFELVTFTHEHIPQARELALSCYNMERTAVPALPAMTAADIPSLEPFADNSLGVAAVEDGVLAGFLCCHNPWDNHFGTARGTFTPVHAHGAAGQDRGKLYSLMYTAAADRWVKRGILSHAISLFTHDSQAVGSFFRNGFGVRCADAVRPVTPLGVPMPEGVAFRELGIDGLDIILPMKNELCVHLSASPVFMPRYEYTKDFLRETTQKRKSRFFIAVKGGIPAAFVEIMSTGENYACEAADMANICGAYAYPEYRGTGLYAALLDHLLSVLRGEGYARLGVDYESINPTARGFWEKYFTPYTYSVTRRIDERVCQKI